MVTIQKISLLILPFISLLTTCRSGPEKQSAPEAIRVKVSEVRSEQIAIPVHSSGIITSSEEMRLSFKIGGIVAKINVKEGDNVKQGDILATLDLSEISAKVKQAEDGYAKAQRDYNRTSNLYRDSVATLEQMQNAATAMNVARSGLDIARFNLHHARILAPDNGRILKQFIKANELVSSGYPVFLFGITGKSWIVKAGLSDRDIIKVNSGDSAFITLDAHPDKEFRAVIDQVGEMANPLTGTYEVKLMVDNEGHKFASGFIAEVEIFPSSTDSLHLVPVGSIVEADGLTGYVYVVTDSNNARKIKVDIITIIGSNAAVRGLFPVIREIVTEGAAYLKEGEKVKVVRDE